MPTTPPLSTALVPRFTSLEQRFTAIRGLTEQLAALLSAEDQTAQSMPDTSPTKWHRAHTTWFFEEFVLPGDVEPYDATFRYLFNSYYEAVGPRHPRPERGLVTRPGVEEVGRYRRHVDGAVLRLLDQGPTPLQGKLLLLGTHHEQQHQELLVMDAKHLLSRHAFGPELVHRAAESDPDPTPVAWTACPGGLHEIGAGPAGDAWDAFAWDNEAPAHRVYLEPFEMASRAVTVQEWLGFMDDGGYRRPELWLSDGWHTVQSRSWQAPEYWWDVDGTWMAFTTAGVRPLRRAEPVCHVSFYEADAYARWAGARLPTEQEWEVASTTRDGEGELLDVTRLHPGLAGTHRAGDVWEWTASAYLPYPGFRPEAGAVGEYNGKFMSDQHVLRGASCATPRQHVRDTYRNFYPASARWAFSGLRLAR